MKEFSKIDELDKEDYYYAKEGYIIFTEKYHLKRGIVVITIVNIVHIKKKKKRKNKMTNFKNAILEGIPKEIPVVKKLNTNLSHAPKRKRYSYKRGKEISYSKRLTLFS